jgi:hypothetical protein
MALSSILFAKSNAIAYEFLRGEDEDMYVYSSWVISEWAGEGGDEGEGGDQSKWDTVRESLRYLSARGFGEPERPIDEGGGPLGRLRPVTRFPYNSPDLFK